MFEKSRPFAFQCSTAGTGIEFVDATDHIVHFAEAQLLRHDLANLLRNERRRN